jgi:hypothetical protein
MDGNMAKSETNDTSFEGETNAYRLVSIIQSSKPKSVKKAALRQLRAIERRTGKNYLGSYNGGPRNPSELQRLLEESGE